MKKQIKLKYDYKYSLFSTIIYFVGTVMFLVCGLLVKPLLLALFAIGMARTAASWAGMRNELDAKVDENHIEWGDGDDSISLEWSAVKCKVIQKDKYTELVINTGYSKHKLFFFDENKTVIDELIPSLTFKN